MLPRLMLSSGSLSPSSHPLRDPSTREPGLRQLLFPQPLSPPLGQAPEATVSHTQGFLSGARSLGADVRL